MISRRNRKAGVVIETILILAGLGLLVKAGMTGMSTYRFIHAIQTAPFEGTIIGIEHYGFTLDIQVMPGGSDQSFAFGQDVVPLGYRVGDQVPVFYDPGNPYRTVMSNFTATWFDTIALALAGLIVAALGFRMRGTSNL